MEIEVLTYGKRKELLEKLAKFYAKQLKITQSNYKVFIVTDPTLKSQGSQGVCARTGEREISVALYSYLNFGRMVYTLAHEMVHVKQMIRGHYRQEPMKYGKGVYHYWLGKRVSTEYLKRPWEKEAMRREQPLVDKLYEYICKKGKQKA
jgi:hypothetical protein